MNKSNKKWSVTNPIPFPTAANMLKLSAKGIKGVADSLYNCVEVDPYNDLGQLALELTMLILTQISDKMSSEQTLEDFFG